MQAQRLFKNQDIKEKRKKKMIDNGEESRKEAQKLTQKKIRSKKTQNK